MKKPKVIRFRCYCFECSGGDARTDDKLRSTAAEPDQDNKKPGEEDPRLLQDSIGKLLFGA
ncbi:MAG: hypothetical protein BGP09_22795 [Rhizobium sp. 60-20]|jgi:hypothetical protein|nr:MAG: hypothetical protein BGP09_22795 [Rhizobium sp. 60-20]RKD60236.1 hypothetical protein BJ928_109202 [Rhizobium sp. WW_1]